MMHFCISAHKVMFVTVNLFTGPDYLNPSAVLPFAGFDHQFACTISCMESSVWSDYLQNGIWNMMRITTYVTATKGGGGNHRIKRGS